MEHTPERSAAQSNPGDAAGDPTGAESAAEAQERADLMAQLLSVQATMETTILPRMIEPLLATPLTIQQLKVLVILVTEVEDNTVQGLASILSVSLATMSGILDRLTTHGMARRTEDPIDHRVRRVVATPEGKSAIQRLLVAQPQMQHAPLELLATEDLRALTRGMGAYLRLMELETDTGTGPA